MMASDVFEPNVQDNWPHAILDDSVAKQVNGSLTSHDDVARFMVVDSRAFERECFLRSVSQIQPDVAFVGCDSIDSCIEQSAFAPRPNTVVMRVDHNGLSEPGVRESIRRLVDGVAPVPVVVLCDSEDIAEMIATLDCGAKGCVPASMGLDEIVEAMKLATAGAVLLTVKGLSTLRHLMEEERPVRQEPSNGLTSRQGTVAEALRQGKANKIIAHELGMCESTVKIHVRNILKKLQVTNRTEAACKLNAIRSAP